jgi:hypothetical protein
METTHNEFKCVEEDLLLDEDLKFFGRAELGVIYFRNVNFGKELK